VGSSSSETRKVESCDAESLVCIISCSLVLTMVMSMLTLGEPVSSASSLVQNATSSVK